MGLRNTILPSIMMTSVVSFSIWAGVQAHRKVVDIDAILPVGREIVLEPHAAAQYPEAAARRYSEWLRSRYFTFET